VTDSIHIALYLDIAVFGALAWRVHTAQLYESGMMLRIALLCAYAWLVLCDVDNVYDSFSFMPFSTPGDIGRIAVIKTLVFIGVAVDIWRRHCGRAE